MIGDYTKYVLTKSKKCKIKSDSLVKGLNKLGIGTRYGHWVLDIDDFILFNNEKSEMTEAYENNFNTQSEKKTVEND